MHVSSTTFRPVMMRSYRFGGRSRLAAAVACVLGWGCGPAEAYGPPHFEASGEAAQGEAATATSEQRVGVPATQDAPPPVPGAPIRVDADPSSQPLTPPADPFTPPAPAGSEPEAGARCQPAPGVSGAPQTISEAIALLNGLPKPTPLACFIEALDRPLTVYLTKSDDSLQPSPGARSPRAFILRGDLELSIVLDGPARDTLEFGFRPEPARSIKAELLFPVTGDVSETSLFDRVQVTPRTTKCGACHVGEAHEDYPGFPLGVFASDILEPYDFDEVSLDSLNAEAQSCDPSAEPYRCELLAALLDHGEVAPGRLRGRE